MPKIIDASTGKVVEVGVDDLVEDYEKRLTSIANTGRDLYGLNEAPENIIREIKNLTGREVSLEDYLEPKNTGGGAGGGPVNPSRGIDRRSGESRPNERSAKSDYRVQAQEERGGMMDSITDSITAPFRAVADFIRDIFAIHSEGMTITSARFYELAISWLPKIFLGWFIIRLLDFDASISSKKGVEIEIGD